MKIRWKDEDDKRQQGDVISAVAKPPLNPALSWETFIIVRGEDGLLHEVPLDRFLP